MTESTTSPPSAPQALSSKDLLWALGVALSVSLVMAIWYVFDHHIPMMDEAGHILNGLGYRELFLHPRPWRLDWLHKCLSVNTFYPPTVYVLTGLLKTIMGAGRQFDIAVHVFYTFLLSASLFLTCRLLNFTLLSAACAAILVNSYPEISSLNHIFMLDFPAVSAASVGIFLLTYWWRRPTWINAIWCGILIGFCCLTKQIVAAFLLGPGFFYFVQIIRNKGALPQKTMLAQIFLLAGSTAATGAPWLLANYKAMQAINEYAQTNLVSAGQKLTPIQSAIYYLSTYSYNLSPLGCLLFLASIFSIGKQAHAKLAPLWASAMIGFLLMSNYVYPLDRYIAPSVIFIAAASGVLLANLWQSQKLIFKILAGLLSSALLAQYLSFNFTPYPITSLPPLTILSKLMGVRLKSSTYSRDGTKENPFPYEDWGYDWALNHIKTRDGAAPVYFNIMANKTNLNAQTFDLMTKEQSSPVRATTSRTWSIVGDEYSFDPEKTMYFHWFLIKEGDHGAPWKNKKAEQDYEALKTFLNQSGKFELIDRHKCPDGQDLILYRQAGLKL